MADLDATLEATAQLPTAKTSDFAAATYAAPQLDHSAPSAAVQSERQCVDYAAMPTRAQASAAQLGDAAEAATPLHGTAALSAPNSTMVLDDDM